MVDVSTIQRTSNVIAIKGVSFAGISGKKTKMVPIEFSDNESIISNCSASQYQAYKNGTTIDNWGKGIATINKEIDIITPHNNGAKYIYVLSTSFVSRTTGALSATTSSMALVQISSGTYTNKTNTPIIIKKHEVDEQVANNNSFDNYITELLYTLDASIENGATKAVFSYCADPGPHTASGSTPYTFTNTVIDKPLAYFVYEE